MLRYFLIFFFSLSASAELDIPQVKKEMAARLAGQGDLVRRDLKRAGNRTIELDIYLSTEMNLPLAKKVLEDFPHYRDWALKHFNTLPTGGDYRFRVNDLTPVPGKADQLGLQYSLNIPLFTRRGQQLFRLALKPAKEHVVLSAYSVPKTDAYVEKAYAHAVFFQQPANRAWIYIKASLTVHSWLLYQALPEALIERMIGDRIERLSENLLDAQDALSRQTTAKNSLRTAAPAP